MHKLHKRRVSKVKQKSRYSSKRAAEVNDTACYNDNNQNKDNKIKDSKECNPKFTSFNQENGNNVEREEDHNMECEYSDEYKESQRYIAIAIREMDQSNYDRALKLLEMAKNLYPNPQADELKALILKLKGQSKSASSAKSTPSESTEPPSTSGARKRKYYSATGSATSTATSSSSATSIDNAPTPNYTQEQLDMVIEITQKCKNFYQVLGVANNATDSDLKRAYKKLALQLHPDKNNAPGADEAFKMVGTAFAILTDEDRREEYNAAGANGLKSKVNISPSFYSQNERRHDQDTYSHAHLFNSNFDDLSAEELFNLFFGTSTNRRRRTAFDVTQQQQRTTFGYHDEQNEPQASLAYAFILIILILLTVLSTFFISDPVYNMQPSSQFPIRRETQELSVPYYVSDNFKPQNQASLLRLEKSIDDDFVYTLKQKCQNEKAYRDNMMARARNFGSRIQFAQAQRLKMSSCNMLSKIKITRFLSP